ARVSNRAQPRPGPPTVAPVLSGMKKAARKHPEAAPFVTSLATNQPLHLSVRCNGESVATGSPQAIPDADEPRLFAPLQPGFFLSGPKGRAARYPLRGRPVYAPVYSRYAP